MLFQFDNGVTSCQINAYMFWSQLSVKLKIKVKNCVKQYNKIEKNTVNIYLDVLIIFKKFDDN